MESGERSGPWPASWPSGDAIDRLTDTAGQTLEREAEPVLPPRQRSPSAGGSARGSVAEAVSNVMWGKRRDSRPPLSVAVVKSEAALHQGPGDRPHDPYEAQLHCIRELPQGRFPTVAAPAERIP
jgi:hypothetical protein